MSGTTSEQLQERNQRALVRVAERRLVGLEVRAEIVSLVDDEVRTLADGDQPVDETRVRKDVFVVFQIALEALEQIDELLLAIEALLEGEIGAHQVGVGQETHRKS